MAPPVLFSDKIKVPILVLGARSAYPRSLDVRTACTNQRRIHCPHLTAKGPYCPFSQASPTMPPRLPVL